MREESETGAVDELKTLRIRFKALQESRCELFHLQVPVRVVLCGSHML